MAPFFYWLVMSGFCFLSAIGFFGLLDILLFHGAMGVAVSKFTSLR